MLKDYHRMDGHMVCATPGTVAGLSLAHKHYGRLPWRELVLPAVRLAREGFSVDAALLQVLMRSISPRSLNWLGSPPWS
jgi:gamma-glutamyltranspeptidase/glutathione hydrolase